MPINTDLHKREAAIEAALNFRLMAPARQRLLVWFLMKIGQRVRAWSIVIQYSFDNEGKLHNAN